jgi:sugar diacid utilization regulator
VAPRDVLSPDDRRAVVTGGLVLCPVVAADDRLGCLVMRPDGPVDDAEVRLLERGAVGIALSLVQQRAVSEATLRSRGELLTALVEGGDVDELARRASAARVDLSRPHVVALVDATDAASRRAAGEQVRRCEGIAAARGGRVVALLPAGADLQPLARLACTGASGPVQGVAAVPAAFAEAERCLRAALALGREHVVATGESLGLYRYLLAGDGPAGTSEFVQRTIGPLLEHDAARGTELVRTAEAYLAKGRQHTAAAEVLHIHPNTLYQRLARIGSVLGDSWRDEDRALDLHLALRLHALATTL